MANSRKKISELPALSVASLDTTFVLGISGSTTYKISINNLTSSLDTTFATDLVTNALSNTLDTKLSTSSFNSYTASISTGSLITSILNLNTFTASVTTASIVTSISNLNTFTASISTASLVTSISNLNTFTASQSTSSLVDRLNAIESVSGSWITESETGSFLTSLSGAISSSSQLTSSYDTRYTLSGSVQPLPSNLLSSSAQITAFGFISSSAAIPTGTISGSSQLTSSFDTRYVASGSISAVPVGTISGSAQISAFGFATTGSSVPAWTSAGAITLTATTTNPTKGTTTSDNINYRQLGAKEWEVVMTYIQSVNNGGGGSGDYLITLPNGLSFDTTLPSQPIYTANVGASTFAHFPYVIPNSNGTITNHIVGAHIFPMVYSATKFRILTITYGSGIQCWSSGFYSTADIPKIQLTFRFTST